ncbi:MAG TPA: DNA-directed RNA polymerase subunit P [Ignisphaera aggregans]|uniref:DNA-directed RNA polymerase subunit Rpo12 n=1 Tax=Ignisphaera aggregans TaxID=334771 RepID=A0A833DV08_9CREN|nr:DNA-directed RNA polymerase subunit P [Ignisphaera aggregans]
MVKYVCLRCKREFDETQLAIMMTVRCPYCGYRVVAKVRGEEVKILRAI